MQGRESAHLDGVGVGAFFDQDADGFGILAERDGCVQWLVAHGGGYLVDIRAVVEQDLYSPRSAEGCCEVEGRPAVAGDGVRERGVGCEQSVQSGYVADGCGFMNVEGFEAGEQEVADNGLAAVDRPKQSRDTLGVPALCYRRIVFDLFGDLGGCAAPNQCNELMAHGGSLPDSVRPPAARMEARLVDLSDFLTVAVAV